MRHRHKGKTLDRNYAARKALVQHLAESLIVYERIKTTPARAKAVQPFVERAITLGKEPTLAHRRQLLQALGKPRAVAKVVEVLSPRYLKRLGGYTRRIHGGWRQGDGAAMVNIAFVEEEALAPLKGKES